MDQNTKLQPSILPLGIISLVLALTGYGGIISLILAAVGRKKGKQFIAEGGTLEGPAKTGFGLCKAALILSIIAIVCAVIVTIILAVLAASGQAIVSSY